MNNLQRRSIQVKSGIRSLAVYIGGYHRYIGRRKVEGRGERKFRADFANQVEHGSSTLLTSDLPRGPQKWAFDDLHLIAIHGQRTRAACVPSRYEFIVYTEPASGSYTQTNCTGGKLQRLYAGNGSCGAACAPCTTSPGSVMHAYISPLSICRPVKSRKSPRIKREIFFSWEKKQFGSD